MWLLLLVAVTTTAVVYFLLIRTFNYWADKGVKQENLMATLMSNWNVTIKKVTVPEMLESTYNMFPNSRYSGLYQFFLPILLIKDPELIKHITVKDFDHFLNHRALIPKDSDPVWDKVLGALNDQKWRDMRTTLSPAFTSSKMRYMFSLMSQNGRQFVNYFLKQNQDMITLEMKDTVTRFTNDVIANTIFGVECDSLGEPSNEFYLMGKELTDFSGFWKIVKFFGLLLFPKLNKVLSLRLFSEKVSNFFKQVIKANIESREKHGIVRPDMLNLLLEAQKTGLQNEEEQPMESGFAAVEESLVSKNRKSPHQITDEDIAAQAMLFFFGGFESVSSLMCFMSYELALNPDIQQKLILEVSKTLEACGGNITYEALLGMKYMDMVVSESLRKWPNAVVVDRVCTKPYTIEPKYPDEVPVHFKPNDAVWIPVFTIHRDPQYYPNPERFDPERFSEENKGNIKPCSYLPFGAGPRNCIGSRFALLETKILFFYILANFEIVPVQKTQVPLKIKGGQLNLGVEAGFWLGLKRRAKLSNK